MKIKLQDGQMYVNDKQVMFIVFNDQTTQLLPVSSTDTIEIDDSLNTSVNIKGDKNVVISGKNIVTGSIITTGDFKLGDG